MYDTYTYVRDRLRLQQACHVKGVGATAGALEGWMHPGRRGNNSKSVDAQAVYVCTCGYRGSGVWR